MVLMMSRRAKEVPTNPATGEKYRFEMLHNGGRAAYAETYSELCEALVGYDPQRIRDDLAAGGTAPGGLDPSNPEQLESAVKIKVTAKRIMYAVRRAVWLQALVNTDHRDEIEAMDKASRRIISGTRCQQPAITEWSHNVPLVLSHHEYAPYGNKPKPRGENIWWINPYTERSLVQSLNRIGDIQVFYRNDTNTPAGPRVTLRPATSPAAGGPLLLASGDAANRMVESMMSDGASFETIMIALDAADHLAVFLNAEAATRDDTQQLVGWLQNKDITIEQFILALANAGIPALTTGSSPAWAPSP